MHKKESWIRSWGVPKGADLELRKKKGKKKKETPMLGAKKMDH